MANRKGKGRTARTSSAGSESKTTATPPPPPPPAPSDPSKSASSSPPKPAPGKGPRRTARRPRSKSRPTSISPNSFTRKDVYPMEGELSLKLPTDYVVCMRGLARRHGRTLVETFQATLWSYLRLTRSEQRRAMDLEPAMPVQEVAAWGGVHSDGGLMPWASRNRGDVYDVLEDDNQIVRVVIRHLPGEPGIRPRGWKE